jgi:DNA invertase Pin-like site-specific DNA recombinase
MAVYAYCMVSPSDRPDGVSLDEQQRRIRGRALEEGWAIAAMHVEEGVSGSMPFAERPQGKVLLDRVQPGDIIIAAKLDRAFRNALDARNVVAELESRHVKLYLLDLGGDVVADSSISRMLLTIMAAVAEFERNRIAERIAEGKAQQRIKGTYLGGWRQFGWRKKSPDDITLLPVAEEQAAIAEIYAAHDRGLSLRAIQACLNQKGIRISRGTVANRIHRRPTGRH